MTKNIIIKTSVQKRFDSFMVHGRVLFFSAPCGFGKTVLADALLRGRNVLRQSAARKQTANTLQIRFPFKNAEKYKPSDFRHSCRSLGFVFLYYLIYILFVYVCGMIMFSGR